MDDAAQAFLKTKIMDNIQVIIETLGCLIDARTSISAWKGCLLGTVNAQPLAKNGSARFLSFDKI